MAFLIMAIRFVAWFNFSHVFRSSVGWYGVFFAETVVAWWIGWKYDTMKFHAQKDSLTEAYNRRFIETLFPRLVARSDRNQSPLAVMVVDVDDLKSINDNYGHQVGDLAIKRVAHVLFDKVRKSDFVIRWGGDEFVIVAPETGREAANQFADRIRHELSLANQLANNDVIANVSIGIGIYPEDAATFNALFDFADRHMYGDKHPSVV